MRKNLQVIKKCIVCSKDFNCFNYLKEIRKFCSRDCRFEFYKKEFCSKGGSYWKGKKRSEHFKYIHKLCAQERRTKPVDLLASKKLQKIMNSAEYKEFKQKVREKFYNQCVECKTENGRLDCHHIKSKKYFPELIFYPSNALLLCFDCHKKTDSYAKR